MSPTNISICCHGGHFQCFCVCLNRAVKDSALSTTGVISKYLKWLCVSSFPGFIPSLLNSRVDAGNARVLLLIRPVRNCSVWRRDRETFENAWDKRKEGRRFMPSRRCPPTARVPLENEILKRVSLPLKIVFYPRGFWGDTNRSARKTHCWGLLWCFVSDYGGFFPIEERLNIKKNNTKSCLFVSQSFWGWKTTKKKSHCISRGRFGNADGYWRKTEKLKRRLKALNVKQLFLCFFVNFRGTMSVDKNQCVIAFLVVSLCVLSCHFLLR